MNIDLNNHVPKPLINSKVLDQELTDSQIYSFYMNTSDLKLNTAMSSPLRDDPTPSFGFFLNKKSKIIYNDFVTGGGDCYKFVKELFGYSQWFDVYSQIAVDFNLDSKYICSRNITSDKTKSNIKYDKNIQIQKKAKCDIGVTKREWQTHDLEYWNSFNISKPMLIKYRVFPLRYIFLNKRPIAADKHAYVYIETKDRKITHKIYQPFSKFKWITDNDNSVWQGWQQLPNRGDVLIITKSLKDVMSIKATTGFNAIALQNEKANPKDVVIEELKVRFDRVFILFDNDYDKSENWGQINGKEISRDYMIKNLLIEKEYKSKDFSDLVANHGKNFAKELLNSKINKKDE